MAVDNALRKQYATFDSETKVYKDPVVDNNLKK